MERVTMFICFVLLVILISCSIVSAQSSEPKYEIGFQVPYIIQSASIRDNLEGIPGFGGRFTYNINNSFSAETDVNFFRETELVDLIAFKTKLVEKSERDLGT